jgi:hypothetical protein
VKKYGGTAIFREIEDEGQKGISANLMTKVFQEKRGPWAESLSYQVTWKMPFSCFAGEAGIMKNCVQKRAGTFLA